MYKNIVERNIERLHLALDNLYYSFMMPDKLVRGGNGREIVVSLTSFGARLAKVHLTVKSLLNQTLRPDRIVLYLDAGTDVDSLPSRLTGLKKCGLEITTGYENLKPHTKYFYAVQEHPDAIIVTVDDDMIYHRDLVRTLMESYRKYPECISAVRTHRMTLTEDKKEIEPYNLFEGECTTIREPSHSLMATGVGGVLYPPGSLPRETFNQKDIKEQCLCADDIWLKFMEIKAGTKVVCCAGKHVNPVFIWKSQNTSLQQSNVDEKLNDVYIKQMLAFCGKDEIMSRLLE